MKLFCKILFLWIVVTMPGFGQSDLLKGQLIDAATIEPVAFATVRVKGRAVGVISNYDGSFSVPEKFKELSDTLEISSMGFQNRQILISTLSVDKVRRIYMQPALFELDEAVVKANRKRKLSARQIVRRAIKNIPKNYPQNLFSTVGYYRDYQFKDDEYINLNEAVLEVFDSGFETIDSVRTEVQIYDYKKNIDFKRDSLSDRPYNYKTFKKIVDRAYLPSYSGNEFSLLRVHNAIRNYELNSFDFVNRMEFDLLENHQFSKKPNTYLNDELLYVIFFRYSKQNATAEGKLFISSRDYAIHKMEYVVYDRPKLIFVNGVKERSKQIIFEVNTEYRRQLDGKMFLNYISFHNSFRVSKPSPFFVDEVFVNYPKRRFEVNFTREPFDKTATLRRNYNFKFDGKRIDFEKLILFENQVFLYPKFIDEQDSSDFERISLLSASKEKKDSLELKKLLLIKIDNLSDKDGNMINRRYYEDYDQYREYFVQQVKTKTELPTARQFMNKRKPIFEDQPISPPGNFDDYWMNTPLQRKENKKPVEG